MKIKHYLFRLFLAAVFLTGLNACEEKGRFEINSHDSVPPGTPEVVSYTPLTGGARIFYKLPADEDLLSINAEYVAANGKTAWFSASYFVDSLDVYGFADVVPYTVKMYAIDRAGNKSKYVNVEVTPLEAALPKVEKSIVVKPAVKSFFVEWENELLQSINVYVDFTFIKEGVKRSLTMVFSSNNEVERRFITDLDLEENVPVEVKVRIEDMYGNKSATLDMGEVILLHDVEIPKDEWVIPPEGYVKGGVVEIRGNTVEGRMSYLIDGIINTGDESNFIHTGTLTPWNILIDLGDYYELCRIATWQRRFSDSANQYSKGSLYGGENVGSYNMYLWDEEADNGNGAWELISYHRIPIPQGLSDMEIIKQYFKAGDVAYMYPDEPTFTKPTRWFRYEARSSFSSNYTGTGAANISELSLYGRKANR